MLPQPSAKKAVALLIEDELKTAVIVAESSTKAMGRAFITGTIPIIELGLIVAFTLLVARIPLKVLERVQRG